MNFATIRAQFPQLKQKVKNYPLVYLDSAATTLKPQVVIDRLTQYYTEEVSNVHRGAHYFSNLATENYESSRKRVAEFLSCKSEEVIFTSGTTDGLNLLAYALDVVAEENKKDPKLKNKTEILLTESEHHSGIVPWYWFAQRHGFEIKTIPVLENGCLDLDKLGQYMTEKTFLVSAVHMSNTLGTLNDVKAISKQAKALGAYSVVDAAQSVSWTDVSVKDIGCDFLVFSSHKIFGPEGLGVLFGRQELLDQIGFYKGGGSMISKVTFPEITFLKSPQKFEAGTPAIGPAIALKTALDFFSELPQPQVRQHETELLRLTDSLLQSIPGYTPMGDVSYKNNILSFNIKGIHASDIGSLIDEMGVAVRVGHHCTQPLLAKMGENATIRASFSIYNNAEDCHILIKAVKKAVELLK